MADISTTTFPTADPSTTSGTCTVNMVTFFLTLVMKTITKKPLSQPAKLPCLDEYDFIIVGAGSAGCVLANRLSEVSSWKILLLEAGGEEPPITEFPAYSNYIRTPQSDINWNYPTQQHPSTCIDGVCNWPRGKCLGGSSAINVMYYIRGNRRDYDRWRDLGNPCWGYDDVLPLFKKSENNLNPDIAEDTKYHSTGGFLGVQRLPYVDDNVRGLVQAFKEKGYKERDLNAEEQEGVMVTQTTSKDGYRQSTNQAFLRPVREARKGLEVITHARVTRVTFNRQRKATGVEFVMETDDPNDRIVRTVKAKMEVILSAGTIGSAQILQLSGIGPREVLAPLGIPIVHEAPVGQNIQDHITVPVIQYHLTNTIQLPQDPFTYFEDMAESENSFGRLLSLGSFSAVAFIKSSLASQNHSADLEFLFGGVYDPDVSVAPNIRIQGSNCHNSQLNTLPVCYYNMIVAYPILLDPQSRGNLSISSKDPFVTPVIYPNYFTAEHDVKVMREGLRFVYQMGRTKALKNMGITVIKPSLPGCENFTDDSDELYDCFTRHLQNTLFHPVGSVKMGPKSDPSAVVDSELNVRGVSRLRVIDASIMPVIITGHTNAPTIMIAEKGANVIKLLWAPKGHF